MKHFIPGAIVMLALFSSVNTFAWKDPATRAGEVKQKLRTDLKLTDIQADLVVSINQEFMPQRREVYQDKTMSDDDKKFRLTDDS